MYVLIHNLGVVTKGKLFKCMFFSIKSTMPPEDDAEITVDLADDNPKIGELDITSDIGTINNTLILKENELEPELIFILEKNSNDIIKRRVSVTEEIEFQRREQFSESFPEERIRERVALERNSRLSISQASQLLISQISRLSANQAASPVRTYSAPVDNLDRVFDGYLSDVLGNDALSRALAEISGIRTAIYSRAGIKTLLEEAYVARAQRFRAEFKDVFELIKELSRTRVAGVAKTDDGTLALATETVDVEAGTHSLDELLAQTSYSLPRERANAEEVEFNSMISREDMPRITDGLYEISTMIPDPKSRVHIVKRLVELEDRRKREWQIKESSPIAYDAFIIGMSVAASNFATVFRFLRPDTALAGVDQYSEPGYLWNRRGWFPQNNTLGPAAIKGGNLPREGGDLFPLGNFGAMRLPYVSQGRWPTGDRAGLCIRWNLHESLDDMLLDHAIVDVDKDDRRGTYVVTAASTSTQKRKRIFTRSLVMTGIGEEKNPFVNENGGITDQESYDIWMDEISKAKKGEAALIYTLDLFSDRIRAQEGIDELMAPVGDRSRKVGVAGDGNGGEVVVLYLLELAVGEKPYGRRVTQIGGPRPEIPWFGQKARTQEEYSKTARAVYAQICAGYTSRKIKPEPRKMGAIRYEGAGLRVLLQDDRGNVDINSGSYVDTLVTAIGYKAIPDGKIMPSLAQRRGGLTRVTVYDREGRAVASKLDGEEIYFAGVSSKVPIAEVGADISELFKQLGIPENEVATWVRGYQAQRFAMWYASRMPASDRQLLLRR